MFRARLTCRKPMVISLDSVVEAARRRLAALTPEVAGYVVLLATRRLGPRPSRVSLGGVLLTDGGDVQVRHEPASNEIEMESDLRAVLATLLELSPSPVPAITAAAEASACGSLPAFIAELSAALIPINHAAAHRALARLYRETIRAGGLAVDEVASPVSLEEAPEPHDALLELTAAPPPVMRIPSVDRVRELDIDMALDAGPEPASPCPVRVDRHSDLRELLLRFLYDARSDERMARTLRAMIDLVDIEDCSPPTNGCGPDPSL
jgi:hypothetical protein